MSVSDARVLPEARLREKNAYTIMATAGWFVPLVFSALVSQSMNIFAVGILYVFPMTIPLFILCLISVFRYDRRMWLAFTPFVTYSPLTLYFSVFAP
ncbi:hypothetical protein [Hoeflea prorocentri]|uniref:Uncharacterized protein n=1 Tax=Hoeflea prorocentri TaxID=1922333 RepID=A0A9X3UGQ1_9HYPH|nr:hypothetical protein [Hoeflea prorocentri]MCY6380987.1 hypothetical protein [Hoeflea prorocentri]MDA5398787.1 hypothetical protein [Hoeflea prorocentri]